jgi:hypothetical protein
VTPERFATLASTIALLGAGVKYLIDWYRDDRRNRGKRPTSEQRHRQDIDANILTVAKARDELSEDNAALRATLREEREAHAADRAASLAEREQLRAQIAALETRLRTLADELANIRTQHGI